MLKVATSIVRREPGYPHRLRRYQTSNMRRAVIPDNFGFLGLWTSLLKLRSDGEYCLEPSGQR